MDFKISGLDVDGPIVATILVLLLMLKN